MIDHLWLIPLGFVAGILGSLAASCECEIDGNEPIKKELVIDKINKLQKQMKLSE